MAYQKVYSRINWENEPSTETPINEENLNRMDYALNEIDKRVVELDGYSSVVKEYSDKAEQSSKDALNYASSAKDSETNAKTYMNNASTYSSNAKTSETNAKVSEDNANSYSYNARISESNSKKSESSARSNAEVAYNFSVTALNNAEMAGQSANNAKASEDNANMSASTAIANAKLSESFAKGGTGTRTGEDTDNAKYYLDEVKKVTPQTYAELTQNVDNLLADTDIKSSIDESLTLSTSQGGLRLNKIVGKTKKSKNLLKPSLVTATTVNGVTITPLGDGTYVLNGTSTAWTDFALFSDVSSFANGCKLVGIKDFINANFGIRIAYFNQSYQNILSVWAKGDTSGSVITEPTADYAFAPIYISINGGITLNNVVVKPMITEDLSADYSSFEPYGLLNSGSMGCVDLGELNWTVSGASVYSTKPNYIKSNSIGYTSDYSVRIDDSKIYLDNCKNTNPKGNLAYEVADGATPSQYGEVITEHNKNLLKVFDVNGIYSGISIYTKENNISLRGTTTGGFSLRLGNAVVIGGETVSITIPIMGNGSDWQIYWDELDVNGNLISRKYSHSDTRTYQLDSNTTSIAVFIWVGKSGITINEKFDFQIEYGPAQTSFIPHNEHTTIIPLSEPLYESNVISEDGVTKKYGCVDLGDLEWSKRVDGSFQFRIFPSLQGTLDKHFDIYCERYTQSDWSNVTSTTTDRLMALYKNRDWSYGTLVIRDNSYTDPTTFKTSMQGVKLVYELATPTTEPLTVEQTKAIHSLKSYDGKTYVDTVDVYAKATLDVDCSQGEVGSLTLQNYNENHYNRALIDEYVANLQAMILELETES